MAVIAVAAGVFAGCGSTGQATMKPGESMNAAAARAGKDGIVFMDPGTYPAQTVNTGSTGDCVTNSGHTQDCRVFIAKPGVRIGNLRIEGAGTVVMAGHRGDLRIDGAYSLSGARESVIANAVIDPADGDPGVYLDHVQDFALVGSEVTGVLDADGVDVYGGPTGSRDVVIRDNDIHGMRITSSSCAHVDGIQSAGTSGPGNSRITIDRNHVWDVDQNAAYQADSAKGQVSDGDVVTDNVFGPVNNTPTSCVPTPYPRAMNVSGTNLTVRGNKFVGNRAFVYPGTGVVEGNSGPGTSGACSAYRWTANNWTGGGC